MQDTLERERLIDNLVDRLFRAEERIARLEEQLLQQATTEVTVNMEDSDGRWRLYVKDMGGEIGPVLVMREL